MHQDQKRTPTGVHELFLNRCVMKTSKRGWHREAWLEENDQLACSAGTAFDAIEEV
jgi:hypothetical protein